MRGNELPFYKICDELGCCLTTCAFLYVFGGADGLELAASGLLCRLSALNPNLARSWRALQNGEFSLFQTINRVPKCLRDSVRVTPRDLGVARLARRGRVAQQIGDVVLVNIRRPEPCGEGVPEIVKVEIADPSLFDRSLETDH